MIEASKYSPRNEFPELILNDDQGIDLILLRKDAHLDYETLFDELCEEFESEAGLYVYRADKNKINDIEQFYQSLYQFLFKAPLSQDFEMAEMLEILEDELGEQQICIVAAEDFDNFPVALRKAFLELIIVTDSFKLLISVDKEFNLKTQSERLWSVLKTRCTEIDFQNNSKMLVDASSDIEHEYDDVSIKINIDEEEFNEEVENRALKKNSKDESISAWYKMIPRIHLLAAVIVAVLLLLLWRMDVKTEKVETIELNFDSSAFVDQVENNISANQNQHLESIEDSSAYQEQIASDVMSGNQIVDSESNTVAAQAVVIENRIDSVSAQKAEEKPVTNRSITEAEAKPIAPVATVKSAAVKPAAIPRQIDWSPYQSDKWISGLSKNYFTLQLMASHEEQGIRDFLGKHGVNSQYAVYSTQKDGRDWHVVIYGTYQTREFADAARKNLPSYLKNLNPWIRSLADVQKSIQK